MATYNGELFIKEQLLSILQQINSSDEIIIVDDKSTDNTTYIISEIIKNCDSNIKIYFNKRNMGHVFSFSKAISLSSNDLIVMSDQDDVWINGRLSKIKESVISSRAKLISSNTLYINEKGTSIKFNSNNYLSNETSKKYFQNLLNIFLGKAYYYGCAMAFKKDLKEQILPIPKYVESHDLWIAMVANIYKSNFHLEEYTLLRRIHGYNASVLKRKLIPKLYSRYIFILSIFEILKRKHIKNCNVLKILDRN